MIKNKKMTSNRWSWEEQGIGCLDFNFYSLWAQGAWRRDELLRENESWSTRELPPSPDETEAKNVGRDTYSSFDATSGRQSSRFLEVSVDLSCRATTLAGSE